MRIPSALRKILMIMVVVLLIILIMNYAGIDDWSMFLFGRIYYTHLHDHQQIECDDEEYGIICDLADARNARRTEIIENELNDLRIDYTLLPIQGFDMSDVVVVFKPDADNRFTVLTAHFDKSIDDGNYKGAMDNTASIAMFLSLVKDISEGAEINRNVIVVFSGMEEQGFYGAEEFLKYASKEGIKISEVISFDSIGRGEPYIGAIGKEAGLIASFPFAGKYSFSWYKRDHFMIIKDPIHIDPDERIVEEFGKTGISFRVYNRMIAWGEDTFYHEKGYDAVRIYGDDLWYYFRHIDTYEDKVENMDKDSIEHTKELISAYLSLERI